MRTLSPRRTKQEWMDLVIECRKSGLSDRAWCQQQGIAPNTFYYHIKQFRESACVIPNSGANNAPQQIQEIVPIEIQELNVCESPQMTPYTNSHIDDVGIIIDYHGINVKIINSASGSAIYETLNALQKLC